MSSSRGAAGRSRGRGKGKGKGKGKAESFADPKPGEENSGSRKEKGKGKREHVEDHEHPQEPAPGDDGPSQPAQCSQPAHSAQQPAAAADPRKEQTSGDSTEERSGCIRLSEGNDKPAVQVIVLGPSGGPREDRVTSFLVRSLATNWAPNSVVAVDAGTLISAIIHALDECQNTNGTVTSGSFAGLELPCQSSAANAAHIFNNIIGKVLVTHAHLDHVSGLAINTPNLEKRSRPKPVAALPSVVDALKTHLFNDLIWPNLTDENGGVGLITFERLHEGGNPTMDEEEDENSYAQACKGLVTKCFSISHGRCRSQTSEESHQSGPASWVPTSAPRSSPTSWTTVESSAFFLRDQKTMTEILIFGDVEPDKISLMGRNVRVWKEAARKFAHGDLRAIFIECSYVDATKDTKLFGHLCPRHLADELMQLADLVIKAKMAGLPTQMKRKLKEESLSNEPPTKTRSRSIQACGSPYDYGTSRIAFSPGDLKSESSKAPSSAPSDNTRGLSSPARPLSLEHKGIANEDVKTTDISGTNKPLFGLKVYIIHVKDNMTDGPDPRDTILEELRVLERVHGIGCEFHVTRRGESIYI
ncbi:cAMP phosphodiesterases class-II-domain-containing protein [Aspergillus unguis]